MDWVRINASNPRGDNDAGTYLDSVPILVFHCIRYVFSGLVLLILSVYPDFAVRVVGPVEFGAWIVFDSEEVQVSDVIEYGTRRIVHCERQHAPENPSPRADFFWTTVFLAIDGCIGYPQGGRNDPIFPHLF